MPITLEEIVKEVIESEELEEGEFSLQMFRAEYLKQTGVPIDKSRARRFMNNWLKDGIVTMRKTRVGSQYHCVYRRIK